MPLMWPFFLCWNSLVNFALGSWYLLDHGQHTLKGLLARFQCIAKDNYFLTAYDAVTPAMVIIKLLPGQLNKGKLLLVK